jgi:glycerate 2-kinase
MTWVYHTSRQQQQVLANSGRKRWFSLLARTSALTTTTLCGLSGARTIVESAAWVSMAPSSRSSSLPGRHALLLRERRPPSRNPFQFRSFSLYSSQTPTEKEMTGHALQIVRKAIQAVDPAEAIRSHFRLSSDRSTTLKIGDDEHLDYLDYDELVLVSFGKASSAMAATVLKQLIINEDQTRMAIPKCSGVVICKDDHGTKEELDLLSKVGIQVKMASHPVPDERSVEGATALMDLVKERASERTLVICCISGGGSALFCQPTSPLSLADLQAVNSLLLASGMGIQEMNVIRKRLEEGKGGRLAAECYPSQLVTLVLSDVLGDPLDLIASGPTVPDSSTWKDAWDIVQQYQLEDQLPETVVSVLRAGLQGDLPDSPPPEHPAFETSKTVLVGNNALAVNAAAKEAKALGYSSVILGTQVEGEAKEIPHIYIAMAMHLQQHQDCDTEFSMAPSLPVALIAGGETTVSIPPKNTGKGGRNQEMALSAALLLDKSDLRNVVIACVGTDGTDGPTDAAGAVVDATTVRHDVEGARDALVGHNAYPFLEGLGQLQNAYSGSDRPPPLIKTGPTGTNVADICITLIGKPP